MTKLQKWSTQYVAILLALAVLMLLVPKVSAAEYMKSYTLFGSMYGTDCLEMITMNMNVLLSNGY